MSGGEILLTIDLEGADHGLPLENRSTLPELTHRILEFLERYAARATFFVVGAVVEKFPDLIREIADAGHELGLHTYRHTPLDLLDATTFEADTRDGIDLLTELGVERPVGFRAPFFSMTSRTRWAFDVLHDLGFVYDASIVPVWNPVAGYPGHPKAVTRHANGLWIVPLPVVCFTERLGLPIAGGTYLRLLPEWLSQWAAGRYHARGEPVCVFFHPYDIDPDAPVGRVFGNNVLFNAALRIGRQGTLDRIARLMEGRTVSRIIDYVRRRERVQSGRFV